MKDILNQLFNLNTLSTKTAYRVLGEIAEGQYSNEEVASFMTVFKMRPITVEELLGFRDCLRDRSHAIDLRGVDAIDMCGKGGDGRNTFNISTIASFIVAGAGYKVAKHGNYGVSSICGSSNVMEKLGYNFTSEEDVLLKQLDSCNICFLHAPLFHPAMKAVGPVRKNLGVATFFNMLGPMVNPSRPTRQLVGVFSQALQRYYKYIYENSDIHYQIVHSLDGYDEISLTSEAKVINTQEDKILHPEDFGYDYLQSSDLYGGHSLDDAADIFISILNGNGTDAQNAAVVSNAALGIQCFKPDRELSHCVDDARASLESGRAYDQLKKLVA
ncbi:MAG: anthranilate phosphoribosyltransferase [Saprospiraceae bacterium]|nr:anthranilate phosphoribosyltransferase [Saprospiraceae bacterium]